MDLVEAPEAVEDDAELVAAEAGDGVAGPQAGAEPLADGREELVADRVTEALVDRLEPIEVEQDQGDRIVRRPRASRTASGRPGRTAARGSGAR